MQKQTTERKLITHKHFEYFANKTQKLKGLQKCDLTNMVQSFRPRSDALKRSWIRDRPDGGTSKDIQYYSTTEKQIFGAINQSMASFIKLTLTKPP